ncbi:MAG: TonB family protein [Bacteroidales bacterium]|nr:TonB family protein [Bacteroidales bacterium]
MLGCLSIRNRMKIFRFIAVTLTWLSVTVASAQIRTGHTYEELYDSETTSAFKTHVREISSAMFEGRKAGSEGEKLAAEYLEDFFKSYDIDLLSPAGGGELFGISKENGDTLTSRNVIGFVPGYDKELRDKYIVVGARLDNLGTMTMTVDGQPYEKIFYGANGNASGLAMMMELARMVKTNSVLFRRSVLFVAFGASSETYAGAWYFLNRSFAAADNIDAMINLDMLGTGYTGFYAYTSSNADLNALIRTLSGELHPVKPEIIAAEPYPSDHRAFYAKDIPSVMFTTGKYAEHNTERDTQSILDYEMMERELEYIYNFTLALANLPDAPLFHPDRLPGKQPAAEGVVSYYDCDVKPAFLNSTDPRKFLEQWVYQYLKYPAEAVRDGVQGRVMVEFVVNKDGKVSDVKVVKGVSEELDAEAVKVVAASPKWKPAKLNGQKVRCSMTIPVEFRLEKKGRKPSFGIKK